MSYTVEKASLNKRRRKNDTNVKYRGFVSIQDYTTNEVFFMQGRSWQSESKALLQCLTVAKLLSDESGAQVCLPEMESRPIICHSQYIF
jgi:hypothetical protein